MTEPITNLTADWSPSIGIQLGWTAPTDVTNGSEYEVYVLEDVLSPTPTWNLITVAPPSVISSPTPGNAASTMLLVVPPPTGYLFPLASIRALLEPGSTVAPGSFAFSVVHLDTYGNSSAAMSISVFENPQHQPYGSPHFQNVISLDGFGQFQNNPQDSYAEIANSVEMFLGTLPGQRSMVPDYGTPDLPMTQIDTESIQEALNFWEDRANALISVTYDDNNNATLSVQIQGGQGGAQ